MYSYLQLSYVNGLRHIYGVSQINIRDNFHKALRVRVSITVRFRVSANCPHLYLGHKTK